MANYIVTDTELAATASKIKDKLGSNDNIQWKSSKGFADSVDEISIGAATGIAYISVTYPSGSTCTCSKSGTILNAPDTTGACSFAIPSTGTWTVACTNGTLSISEDIAVSSYKTYNSTLDYISTTLNNNSWAGISLVARQGKGDTYWDIGDRKQIILNGKIGTLTLTNFTTYVYILDFNHPINKTTADNNIIFGGFKTALSGGVDIALCDSKYNSSVTSGLYYNMNHKQVNTTVYNSNYGGWKGCDFRYDILGATEKTPNPYNAAKTTSTIGYDATTTAITSPVADTLMAALPSDFRNVLRLHTHYVDNKGNSSNVDANVTSVVDAIFLLSEFEIFGTRSCTNNYEKNH